MLKISEAIDEPAATLGRLLPYRSVSGIVASLLGDGPADPAPLTSADGQPAVVTVPAEIDILNAHAVGEELAAACLLGARVVIADMTATRFCDHAGVRMLAMARRHATAAGAELRLLVPPRTVRIMQMQGLDAVLPLYRSLDQALAGRTAAEAGR